MSSGDLLILLAAAAISIGLAWFFWGPRKAGQRAVGTSSGYQEAMVLVKGGYYTPDVIVVARGPPVRVNFRREESASCSDTVVFGAFGKSARLPQGETVPVELLPEHPGECEFGCPMGMFRGKLVVD